MQLKSKLIGIIAALAITCACSANASTLRVLVVQAPDVGAYVKALLDGQVMSKKKGATGEIRVWRATYAGPDTGTIVVSVEYPSLEAIAKDNALLQSDAEMRAWLKTLESLRKIVSDSIYEEMKPAM